MADVQSQNYSNHRRYVPLYHFVLGTLTLLVVIGATVNFYRALGRDSGRIEAATLLLASAALVLVFLFSRTFALKAQDRAIRAEESLRHYVAHGSLPDPRLDTRQIIGLRFASDAEFGELAKRAAEESLSEEAIKESIKEWRPDHYRV